jgi:hypothetical protein
MSAQYNPKPCKQSQTTSPWTEAFSAQRTQAATSQTTSRPTEQTMPEHASEHEGQAPTHDALSAIYNQGY